MPVHSTQARFYWHTRDWSPYVENVALTLTRDAVEHKPLAGGVTYVKLGKRRHMLTLGGAAWERATVDANAWSRFDESASRAFALALAGDVVGYSAYCGLALANNDQITAGDDIVRLPVGIVGTDQLDRAVILHLLGSTVTSPGSNVDNGADTSNGGAAYLICTALSGGGALTVKIEHSADGSSWADLVTMTALTAVGSEQKIVAPLTTVNRYLRASWTLSAGSATWFLAFGRR